MKIRTYAQSILISFFYIFPFLTSSCSMSYSTLTDKKDKARCHSIPTWWLCHSFYFYGMS